MDGLAAVFLAGVLGLGVFGSGPKVDDATAQKKAAERRHEFVCGDAWGLSTRTGPVLDYETAARRDGSFQIHHCD